MSARHVWPWMGVAAIVLTVLALGLWALAPLAAGGLVLLVRYVRTAPDNDDGGPLLAHHRGA